MMQFLQAKKQKPICIYKQINIIIAVTPEFIFLLKKKQKQISATSLIKLQSLFLYYNFYKQKSKNKYM